ncbi:MAG TPA: PadR family transcriptional regulator [Acidimicrobiales bacterium]|nr:PadR family transcriptional regulator [Acidimicrobiales bacterium]
MSTAELTTTSYALLGLLGIRPWTTYELAQQMQRSLKSFWPRAASRVYEEPKRLVALGLATAKREQVGRRARTVYAITAKGRRALTRWLAEPGTGLTMEFEALLKVLFAEQATREDVLGNIAAARSWAEQQNAENVAFARLYQDGDGPFPERLAAIELTGRFMTDLADMVASWAAWAEGKVAGWPAAGRDADPDLTTLREIAARPVEPAPLPTAPG